MKSTISRKFFVSAAIFSMKAASVFAMAQTPTDPSAPQPPSWVSFVPMVVMVGVFYFLLIRPQSKQRKEHQNLLNAIKSGDKIITSGGFYATVVSVQPQTVDIKLNEETKVRIQKSAVTEVLKNEPEVVATAN